MDFNLSFGLAIAFLVFTPLGHYAHFVMKHVNNLKFYRNLVLRFVQKFMPNILLQKAHEKMISIKSYITNTITEIKKGSKKSLYTFRKININKVIC